MAKFPEYGSFGESQLIPLVRVGARSFQRSKPTILCPSCLAGPREYHLVGCSIETCPSCGDSGVSCKCLKLYCRPDGTWFTAPLKKKAAEKIVRESPPPESKVEVQSLHCRVDSLQEVCKRAMHCLTSEEEAEWQVSQSHAEAPYHFLWLAINGAETS